MAHTRGAALADVALRDARAAVSLGVIVASTGVENIIKQGSGTVLALRNGQVRVLTSCLGG